MGNYRKKQQATDHPNMSHEAESSKEREHVSPTDDLAQQMAFLVNKIQSIDVEMKHNKKPVEEQEDRGIGRHTVDYEEFEMDNPWWNKLSYRRPYTTIEFSKFRGGVVREDGLCRLKNISGIVKHRKISKLKSQQ